MRIYTFSKLSTTLCRRLHNTRASSIRALFVQSGPSESSEKSEVSESHGVAHPSTLGGGTQWLDNELARLEILLLGSPLALLFPFLLPPLSSHPATWLTLGGPCQGSNPVDTLWGGCTRLRWQHGV